MNEKTSINSIYPNL